MQDNLARQVLAAVSDGRAAGVEELTAPLAAEAGRRFSHLQQVMDILAWHEELAHLNRLLAASWPAIRSAPAIRDPAKREFAARAADLLIYAYLKARSELKLESAVADLLPRLQDYVALDAAGLARYVAYLAGLTRQEWQTEDFHFSRTDEAAARQAAANLSALMIEFVSAAQAREGVPYGRGSLVREQLPVYLSMRRTGQLAVRQPLADLMQGKRPLPKFGKEEEPPHPLCPDGVTLPQYFGNLLHFARPRPYKAAALFGLIPSWLRFLQVRGLIDAPQAKKSRADLQPLLADLRAQWADHPDATLLAVLQQSWATGSCR